MDSSTSIMIRMHGDTVISKSTWLVAATVMVYDYGKVGTVATTPGLTIEHEKFMWQRGWCLGKCLYLFTRYLGMFKAIFDVFVLSFGANVTNTLHISGSCKDLKLIPYLHRNDDAAMSNTSCKAFLWWQLFSVTAAIVSVQGTFSGTWLLEENFTLMLSPHAASSHSAMSAIVLALGVLLSLLLMGLDMPIGSASPSGFTGCFYVDGISPRFAFGVLSMLIYETVLCSLMLWKVIQNYRDGYWSSFLSGMVHDSIFTILCLDFTFYYLHNIHKQKWAQFVLGREYTIACAMGCRLLVNTMEWAEVSKASRDTVVTPIIFCPIDRLPAHQNEVRITTVTPAVDESYRSDTAIGQ
ncbi:hypothetical protein BU17DRAFT_69652 [Hysterangium stoloniferum]|nr:hypothetical protein BU17DRAFT_69652 [Hysterangium stoloniferum]